MSAKGEAPKSNRIPSWAVRLRIKHLLMLIALQRTGSVRKAAEQMFVTQPAASKMLADAEEIFGVRLFERGPRGLIITESGALIVERAAHLLNNLEHAREAAAEAGSGAVGVVRVGVLPVAISTVVTEAVVALHQRSPRLRIEIVESSSGQLLRALRRGEFECVIGRMIERPVPHDLERTVLYKEPVCVVARVGHPLGARRRVGLAAASQWPWILPSDRTPLREYLEESWEASRVKMPACPLETVSVQAVVSTLRRTDFLAVMPVATASIFVELGALVYVKLPLAWSPPPIELMTLRRASLSIAQRLFAEEVERAAAAIG